MFILLILISIGMLIGFFLALWVVKFSMKHGFQGDFKFCRQCKFKQDFRDFKLEDLENPVFTESDMEEIEVL